MARDRLDRGLWGTDCTCFAAFKAIATEVRSMICVRLQVGQWALLAVVNCALPSADTVS